VALESFDVLLLDEAEWDADEVSFCTTTNSSHCAVVTESEEAE
jgi:hypothetical protein